MGLFKKFYPWKRALSSYDIDYEGLYADGVRGLIYDIDNTLVEHGADANDRAAGLFKKLNGLGFGVCFISNNKEERVKRFYNGLKDRGVDMSKTHYVYKADKPKKKPYLSAMTLMGTDRESTVFIGDQLFTDIYGANRSGLRSILVRPINPKEEIQIVFKRKLEKPVLRRYEKKIREKLSKSSIVLIGFMGSGKTSVGEELANRLSMECVDTDKYIENGTGKKISDIFAEKGEEYFRKLETASIDNLADDASGMVVCCGGGTPLIEKNVRILKRMGRVIWLTVSPETVAKRLKDDTTRPLLMREDKEDAIRKLMDSRKEKYRAAADIIIDTEGKTPKEIAEEIVACF